MAVEVANSSGLAKTIRPGTYSVQKAHVWLTADSPTAQAPATAEVALIIHPEPYRSIRRPTRGEMMTAQTPPRLTAPANSPRDHPKASVMGTMNTERTATDIKGRAA